uniref:Uncharacterized protein n=1 Tax=Candidatus Kentrum eta TaxID=2126337 RepID=A0A450U594_9GAMM|nr:MAG: hypothetical protein BECKH772A_GA0070896_100013 [Candidatus Kentron sp. H]VFJ95343.1 MAG: hypothetical protein BECKH772C_GA0070978_100023 [Candidatus Kentron sp. H]VFK01164.1 MAG: hypothetical protein BECKH772B_GA0070898_102204 [Candidatus Kentron sp. H]
MFEEIIGRLETLFPLLHHNEEYHASHHPSSPPSVLPSSLARLGESIHFYMENSDPALITKYFSFMPTSMMKPPVIAVLAIEYSVKYSYPFMVFSHEAVHLTSAFSDIAMMEKHRSHINETLGISELPLIVKTITVGVKHHGSKDFFMVTELGNVKIDKRTKEKLSEATGIPRHAMKRHFHINDPDFDPVRNLGLSPGHVGPFPYFVRNLAHILFLKKEIPRELVAIRLTPFDTLIITEILFERLMMAYMKWKGRDVVFISADSD